MSIISRPVLNFIGVAAVAAVILAYSNLDSDKPAKKSAPAAQAAKQASDSEFNAFDYSAHFASPSNTAAIRNVFNPLLKADTAPATDVLLAGKDVLRIPASLAGGDPNWIFTGYATIDGSSQGLLENTATHKGDFVTEGQSWKSCRVASISGGSIAFLDSTGARSVVMRYDPVLAAKAAGGLNAGQSLKPLDPSPAITGPIGPGMPGRPTRMSGGMPGGFPGGFPGGMPPGASNIVIEPMSVTVNAG